MVSNCNNVDVLNIAQFGTNPCIDIQVKSHENKVLLLDLSDVIDVQQIGINLSLAEGSTCQLYQHLQGLGKTCTLTLNVELKNNSHLNSYYLAHDCQALQENLHIKLTGEGASAKCYGVFSAADKQQIRQHLRIEHLASHTESEQLYHGVANDNGLGEFDARIYAAAGCKQIKALQSSHNLLLSKQANIIAKPELEIYTDDIVCSHGATVGQLDDAALFYLCSRGIPEPQAKALLLQGFLTTVLDYLPNKDIKATWLQCLLPEVC